MPSDTILPAGVDGFAAHPAFRLRPRTSRDLALDPYRRDARHTVLIIHAVDGPALIRCRAGSPGSALVEALREASDDVAGACERAEWREGVTAMAAWTGDLARIPATPPQLVEGDLPPLYHNATPAAPFHATTGRALADA